MGGVPPCSHRSFILEVLPAQTLKRSCPGEYSWKGVLAGFLLLTKLLGGPLAVRWAATARVPQEGLDTGLCSLGPKLKT